MEQLTLFSESTVEENGLTNLGAGLSLEIIEGHEKRGATDKPTDHSQLSGD
jgi:hypothetical protein